jgi:hypothetical protein
VTVSPLCRIFELIPVTETVLVLVLVLMQVDSDMHVIRTRGMDHTINCLHNLHRYFTMLLLLFSFVAFACVLRL